MSGCKQHLLSDFTDEDIRNETERRNKQRKLDGIYDMITRLGGDIGFIESMNIEGAPGSGSYRVKFVVSK